MFIENAMFSESKFNFFCLLQKECMLMVNYVYYVFFTEDKGQLLCESTSTSIDLNKMPILLLLF